MCAIGASYILRKVNGWHGIQSNMLKTMVQIGNSASIDGIFVTKRGRPTKTIIKSDAQRALEYRLRRNKGVHRRCKAVVGKPWGALSYPVPQQPVEIIWQGTYDQYEAIHRELNLSFPGHEQPRYCGGDTYILARRQDDKHPYDWRHNYRHFTGSSETWGHLLGRRCWESKWDDIDKEFEFSRRKSVTKVMNAKFETSLRGVPIEAGHIDETFEFNQGPRCLVDPSVKRTRRCAVGATLDVVPAAIPFAPNWREAMADMMLLVPSREKLTPFSGEWSAQAAQGDGFVSSPSQPGRG